MDKMTNDILRVISNNRRYGFDEVRSVYLSIGSIDKTIKILEIADKHNVSTMDICRAITVTKIQGNI